MRSASKPLFFVSSLTTAIVFAASAAAESESPLRSAPNSLPPHVERVLAGGEFELLSLDPTLLTNKQRRRLRAKLFHGWLVLGRGKIRESSARDHLLQALRRAIADSSGVFVYCFEPSHAIRASLKRQTVDLVISFACQRIEVYSPENSPVAVDPSAGPPFDAALKRAGIPLATR